jgi:hypothetical protein
VQRRFKEGLFGFNARFIDHALPPRSVGLDRLQELGAELQEDGSIPLEGQRAGLFRLESATVNGDGTVRFTPAAQGVFADRGIAYAPEGLVQGVFLPGHGNLVYHHLHGPWYEWTSY